MSKTENSTRRFRFSLAALFVLMLCVVGILVGFRFGFQQGYSAGAQKRQSEQPFAKVYVVRELVMPKDADPSAASADYDTLVELITSSVAAETWDEVGGPGSINPFPVTFSLVIDQTPEVHTEIEALLEQLRATLPLADQ